MIGRFANLFAQDLKLAARNLFVIVGLIILVIGIVVYYVLPDELETDTARYYFDARLAGGDGAADAAVTGSTAGAFAGIDSELVAESREELESWVAGDQGSVGIVLEPAGHITLVTGTPLSDEQRALIQAAMTQALAATTEGPATEGAGGAAGYQVVRIQPDAPRLGIDDLLIPVLVAFDVLILGFLFIAVMLFQEKQEGSIWAYRVTPGGTFAYVSAKVALWVALSVVYGTLLAAATVGFRMSAVAWLQYLAVLVLSSLFMTSLGLFVAVFFEGISDWFFVGIVILVANMIPNVSFMNPSFSPGWVTEIPSYSAIFTVRDIMFGTGHDGFFAEFVLRYLIYNAVAVPLAYLGVGRRLLKESR